MSKKADAEAALRDAFNEALQATGARKKEAAHRRSLEALRNLVEAMPAGDVHEAERRGYQRGMMKAMELARVSLKEHEAPLRTADVGRAYTVINGVINYGQFIVSNFESLVGRHLFESKDGEAP